MSDRVTPYEAGATSGELLLEPALALEAVLRSEVVRIQDEHAVRVRKAKEAEVVLRQKCAGLATLEDQFASCELALKSTKERFNGNPGRFSRGRGWLFGIGALMVLAADAVFVTLVLVPILQIPPYVQGPGGARLNPIGALLTFSWETMHPFAEVYIAGLGLVALALVFKAWIDQFPQSGAIEEQVTFRSRMIRTPGGWIVLLIALTFLGLAVSRLIIDYGRLGTPAVFEPTESLAVRFVAMIIGLGSLAGGTFLLTKSLDVLTNHAGRKRQVSELEKLSRARAHAAEAVKLAERIYESAVAERDLACVESRVRAGRARVTDEFHRGFAEGLNATLGVARQPGGYRLITERMASAAGASFTLSTHELRLLARGDD